MEMIYAVTGWRVPFVLVNVSRGLSTPITLEPDHNDCAGCAETAAPANPLRNLSGSSGHDIDRLQVGRTQKISACPSSSTWMVFYLSLPGSRSKFPDQAAARQFVGPFDPGNIRFRASIAGKPGCGGAGRFALFVFSL